MGLRRHRGLAAVLLAALLSAALLLLKPSAIFPLFQPWQQRGQLTQGPYRITLSQRRAHPLLREYQQRLTVYNQQLGRSQTFELPLRSGGPAALHCYLQPQATGISRAPADVLTVESSQAQLSVALNDLQLLDYTDKAESANNISHIEYRLPEPAEKLVIGTINEVRRPRP
ncbi:hypothetical protein EJV47_16145 [Hymenobacter gummosus]|uniref:Uncharacterized protein n=1 Tax=Hymenobacter gummosus TaxID=1776032 RepID=A0A431U0Q1_9BACT|nr:hypothetical protein [Hymenobacter gummosus]RTQ48501.1 hypothetical protein EJV47_16145 [Hymenobacter gummosus]